MGTIFESVVGLGLGNDYVMYVLQCVCYQNNQSFRLLSCAGELYKGNILCPMFLLNVVLMTVHS